ncbi:MAG: hypothetical protein L6Q54_10855 [Leptospiraceae bacterium]|nr:hypothetical protein [Leptospiraceae bacterium]MCK6381727.1 hypothetical protein [Leptospiraceae bacterium]NUM42361.1 hypothetical protein [Leptospiraceae bacterium]
MKYIIFISFAIFVGFQFSVLAEKAPGTMDEFTKVEEYYRNPPASDEQKKKTLEKNLMSAIKISLIKKYIDHESILKDLSSSTIGYEMAPGTFNCYVKYKQFYIFLMYATDPSLYLQTPIEERFYIKPENANLNTSSDPNHQNETKTKTEQKPAETESKK